LTLETIANETKIPRKHLEAIERGNLALMPAVFYQRAEVRAFARAVGLDQNLALAHLESIAKPVEAEPPREIPKRARSIGQPIYVVIALGLIALAAAVVARAISERMPTPDDGAAIASPTASPGEAVPAVRDASQDAVSAQPTSSQAPPPARPASSQGAQTLPVAAPAAPVAPAAQKPTSIAPAQPVDEGAPAGTQAETEPAQAPQPLLPARPVTELVVTTEPAGARVTVNGIGWGVSPVTIRHLPPGDKRIRVSKEGYTAEERVVRITEGRQQALDVSLTSAP
jgi:cytoskeletal protein RodZ